MKKTLIALAAMAVCAAMAADQQPVTGPVLPVCVDGKLIGLRMVLPPTQGGVLMIRLGDAPCRPVPPPAKIEPKRAAPRST